MTIGGLVLHHSPQDVASRNYDLHDWQRGMAADFDGTQSVVFPSVSDTYLADSLFTIAFWTRIDQAPPDVYSLISQRDVCGVDDFLDIRPNSAGINLEMHQPGQVFRVAGASTLGLTEIPSGLTICCCMTCR